MKRGKNNLATLTLTVTILATVIGTAMFCIGMQDMADAIDAGLLHPCLYNAFVGVALLICSLIIMSEEREEI